MVNNEEFILSFADKIEKVLNNDDFYSKSFSALNEILKEVSEYGLFYSFFIIRNFEILTGAQWAVSF